MSSSIEKTKAERTPGRWIADCFLIRTEGNYHGSTHIAHCGGMGRRSEEAEANAAFIAKACRLHDDLLASLKEFVADLLAHAELGMNENEVAMLQRAQSLIAAAEGGAS